MALYGTVSPFEDPEIPIDMMVWGLLIAKSVIWVHGTDVNSVGLNRDRVILSI